MTVAVDTTSSNSTLQAYLDKQAKSIAADKSNTSTTSSTTSTSAATGVFKNETTFLNILTTQLKHQDPTSATDPNQFTQELVQFAGVEQQLNTNKDLEQLINLQKSNSGVTAALGYVGQYIEAPTTNGQFALQGGTAEVGYTLPSAAQNSTISIIDSTGNTIRTLTGAKTAGSNYITWDGKNSVGVQVPDGTYTFSVAAKDINGKDETVSAMRIIGKVTGVTSNTDGTTNLSIGSMSIGTTTVDSIFSAGNLPTATAG